MSEFETADYIDGDESVVVRDYFVSDPAAEEALDALWIAESARSAVAEPDRVKAA